MTADRITLVVEKKGIIYQFNVEDFAHGGSICNFLAAAGDKSIQLSSKADVVTQIIKNKYGKTAFHGMEKKITK